MSLLERARAPAGAAGAAFNASRLAEGELRPATMLVTLLAAFEAQSISYCYWKSRSRASRALAGESDLDLLIDRGDRGRATDILSTLGFKAWPDAPGRDHPAVVSYLGYDESGAVIRHVHAHFRLVVGHSLLKNFRLPIEKELLTRSVTHPSLPIRVLDAVDEALLLVVRANLEMSRLDPVALRRWRELERKFANSLTELSPQVSRAALCERAARLFSPALAEAIADQATRDGGRARSAALRLRIKRELSVFRMYDGLEQTARELGRSAKWAASAINKRAVGMARLPNRRSPGGGALIAFVGVDGSGKSTQVAEAQRWLGAEIDVLAAYFGTGDGAASWLLRPFKAAARQVAKRIQVKPKGASHGVVSDRPPGPLYSAMFAIWAIAVALDKRIKVVSAQRAIARGFVVVTDRYPQNEIAQFNDGPLLKRLPNVPEWLRRLEDSIYATAQRAAPDLVVKLHVGAQTIAKREPDMSPNLILQRIDWLKALEFSGSRVVSIDATRPLEEVKRLARRAIWDIL